MLIEHIYGIVALCLFVPFWCIGAWYMRHERVWEPDWIVLLSGVMAGILAAGWICTPILAVVLGIGHLIRIFIVDSPRWQR